MKKKKKTGGLLAKKPLIRSTPDALPFTVRERKIFAFCDHGAKCVGAECGGCRKVDPMQTAFAIVREGGKTLDTDLKQLSIEIPERVPEEDKAQFYKDMMPVTERIVQLTAKVFGVQLFDGDRGMTWDEIYALFFSFHAYVNDLQKKNAVAADLSLAIAYGDLRKLGYANVFSLWLNRGRSYARSAAAVSTGIAIAFGEDPGMPFWSCLTYTEAEAAELHRTSQRRTAKSKPTPSRNGRR